MKKKTINFIVDVLLLMIAFSATDFILLKVFRSENIWLELGIYIVCYAVVFGLKKLSLVLWNKYFKKEVDKQ